MSARAWPMPDLRNGTTLHLITDTHFGQRWFTPSWLEQVGADMDRLRASAHGHVHAGDMVQWQLEEEPEDDQFLSWLADRRGADGKPWAFANGNHDMASYFGTLPRRDAAAWADALGLRSQNTAVDMGDVRVITVGPETWDTPDGGASVGDCVLSTATLEWLDEQLSATSRPCWITSHAPLWEQYGGVGGVGWYVNPQAQLADLIGSHSNAVGWLSGHRHVDIKTEAEHATSVTVGGRRIFVVNGPAAGGRMNGLTFDEHQQKSPCLSMYVTFLGDAIDVRWREHLRGRWETDGTSRTRHVLLAA